MIRCTRPTNARAMVKSVLSAEHARVTPYAFNNLRWSGRQCEEKHGWTGSQFDGKGHRSVSTTSSLSNSAVFSGWGQKEWHHKSFLSEEKVSAKEHWLESMLQTQGRIVDIEAFLLVLNALAEAPDTGASRRAERWLNRLKDHPGIKPTTAAYIAVIQAWANSNKEQPIVIVNRAERWMNEILTLSEAHPEDHSVRPTIELYNAFLDACTRGRSGRNKRNQHIVEQNARRADAVLRRLHSEYHHYGQSAKVVPNTLSFNYVIRGWTRCKHDDLVPKKVLSLLRLMESYQRSDPTNAVVRPDTKSYCMAMDALVSAGKVKAARCLERGGYTSDTSKNGVAEMEQAEEILKYMHNLHDAGVPGVMPHRVAYNILMTGWAGLASYRHFNAPFKAEEILRSMFTHKERGFAEAGPDRISYEKVMLAWAYSGHPNAGKRANWWLKKLWNDSELQGSGQLLPTTHTYNIVMQALGKSECATAAENLLLDLGDKYREEQSSGLCPNSESFSIVIQAWLRKSDRESDTEDPLSSLHRAVEWLSSLREVENENNLSTAPELFIGVLRSAKRCARERPEILETANETFRHLRASRHAVDTLSYSLLLEVGLEALSGPEADEARVQFVEELFRDCCEDGLVSSRLLKSMVHSRVYETGWTLEECERMTRHLFHTWPLPPAWTRNLRHRKLHPKREEMQRRRNRDAPRNHRPRKENANPSQ